MSIQGNPFIIHDSSLVLSLDAANIKSFRGEPTTNIVQPAWSSWGIDGSGQGSVGTRTIYSDYYCRIVDSAANTRQSIWAYNASPSTTYTFSVKYRKIAGTPTLRFQIQPYAGATYQSSVFPTTAQLGIIDTDDWQTATYSVTGNASTDRFLWFMQDGDDYTTYTHTFELKEAQVEAKTYYTPFVSGSRGTTVETGGGLYDLTNGNNNGTLTNGPTFNAANGGSIVFDGTNDYVATTRVAGTGTATSSVTWACWCAPATVSGDIINMTSGGGWNMCPIWASGQTFYAKVWAAPTLSALSTFTLNQYYYLVLVFNYSASAAYFYINGVLQSSTTNVTYSASGVDNYLGLGLAGAQATNLYFNGKISTSHVYNRALSASEVLQNYNSAKSRFGL